MVRNVIFGLVAALALVASGCATAPGVDDLRADATTSAERIDAAGAPSAEARAGAGGASSYFGAHVEAARSANPVSDSQDPIPIYPAPLPAGSSGDTGHPTWGRNPVASSKR